MRLIQATGLALALVAACAASGALADERAERLMKTVKEATASVSSLQAEVELSNGGTRLTGTMVLKRPNLARIEVQGEQGQTVVSDGKTLYRFAPAFNEYQKSAPGATGANIGALWLHQARGFFRWEAMFPSISGTTTTYLGKQQVEGAAFEVLQLTIPGEPQVQVKYFISPKDHLVHRMVQSYTSDGREVKLSSALKNVRINAPVQAARFKWMPPATARLAEEPDFEKNLLAVGKLAPDFDLSRPGGGRLALSDAVKGKKATLVNFWFYN